MSALPVIERELRAQARSSFTYLIRVLAAAGVLALCVRFELEWGLKPAFGGRLFAQLHAAMFTSIWLLVPLFTADCISRERREGTLGLLFLTPLSSSANVLAKGLVHGLRALTLWLAALPILTIAFLVGGVTWPQMFISMLINFSAICLALASGVIASSFAKRWGHALILAAGLGLVFLAFQIFLTGFSLVVNIPLKYAGQPPGYYLRHPGLDWIEFFFPVGLEAITGIQTMWGRMPGTIANGGSKWLLIHGPVAVVAIGMLAAIIQVAAWNMRRVWHEEPPSARQVWLEQKLLTPVVGVSFLQAWLKRKLDRNPVGWLEQRSWSGRIVTWGWFSVMISFYSVAFRGDNLQRVLLAVQQITAVGMLMVISGVACGSFQRERETRVLELLLISPMKARDIIFGRLRGLWSQFLPCLLLMLVVQASFHILLKDEMEIGVMVYFCSSYFALPVIGLYYSVKSSNFIAAFLSTLMVGLVLPVFAPALVETGVQWIWYLMGYGYGGNSSAPQWLRHILNGLARVIGHLQPPGEWGSLPLAIQVPITVYLGLKLHRNLVRRNFAFIKVAT